MMMVEAASFLSERRVQSTSQCSVLMSYSVVFTQLRKTFHRGMQVCFGVYLVSRQSNRSGAKVRWLEYGMVAYLKNIKGCLRKYTKCIAVRFHRSVHGHALWVDASSRCVDGIYSSIFHTCIIYTKYSLGVAGKMKPFPAVAGLTQMSDHSHSYWHLWAV